MGQIFCNFNLLVIVFPKIKYANVAYKPSIIYYYEKFYITAYISLFYGKYLFNVIITLFNINRIFISDFY